MAVPPYLRIIDRSDGTGKIQFESNLVIILESSRPGGWLAPHLTQNPVRRYRNRRKWLELLSERCANLYMAGWTAAERFHGLEQGARNR
jgi:hypothetical protein